MPNSSDKGDHIRKISEERVKQAGARMAKFFNHERRCIVSCWSDLARKLGLSEADIKALKDFVRLSGFHGPKH